ncbi:MAG: tyrosine-type recombinase/integrase [Lachnospiraceae bacterium]|nr:tyrosine-type recombinase/integrase [Lachnospiraceae bacterium]
MSTTMPIKDPDYLKKMENYYLKEKIRPRNYLLIITGLNTALRISDILRLKWDDVYSFECRNFRQYLYIKEKKTGKNNMIYINDALKRGLEYYSKYNAMRPGAYLFVSNKGINKPITRQQAHRVIKEAAAKAGMSDRIACHSMRKTPGYFAFKKGIAPVLIMDMYNHSSYAVTKRYLGIEQEEKDEIFKNVLL